MNYKTLSIDFAAGGKSPFTDGEEQRMRARVERELAEVVTVTGALGVVSRAEDRIDAAGNPSRCGTNWGGCCIHLTLDDGRVVTSWGIELPDGEPVSAGTDGASPFQGWFQ